MPRYRYRARDGAGAAVEGFLEAAGEPEALGRLRDQGLFVVRLDVDRDIGAGLMRSLSLGARGAGRRIPLRDLALFCRQFSTMIGAGVPIVQTLRVIARQGASARLVRAVDGVVRDLEGGETLSAAFNHRREFPPMMVNMVAAGEVGGVLEGVLERLARHFEREHAVTQKVKSSLYYPAAVVLVALFVVTFLLLFVLPNYVTLFQDMGATLPLPTRIVLTISSLLRRYWYVLAGAVVAAFLGLRQARRTPAGRLQFDRFALMMPLVGPVLSKLALARFARTLGALMASGVPILTAMQVVEGAVGNVVLGNAVRRAQDAVRNGQSIALPLRASGVFPPMIIEMVGVGEEIGAMDAMLYKVADFYEQEIDRSVERLTALIEPVMIILLGGVVGFILVSIVMPMFQVMELIR